MIDPTSREDPKFKELVKVSRSDLHQCPRWGEASAWGPGRPGGAS